jgi:hypothetical protein
MILLAIPGRIAPSNACVPACVRSTRRPIASGGARSGWRLGDRSETGFRRPPGVELPGSDPISLAIVIPLAWLAVERLYLTTQRDNILAQAQLVASALGSEAPQTASSAPYTQASNVLPGIHTRVIDPLGAVVIDLTTSEASLEPSALTMPQLAQNASGPVTPEELVSRPEIAQARLGQPATAIRRVDVAGTASAMPLPVSRRWECVQITHPANPLPDTQWSAFPLWCAAVCRSSWRRSYSQCSGCCWPGGFPPAGKTGGVSRLGTWARPCPKTPDCRAGNAWTGF